MKRLFTLIFTAASLYGSSQCAFTVNPQVTDEDCPNSCNGRVKLTLSGGTSPYTYSWSNSETSNTAKNLCPGTYTCIVGDNTGCKDTLIYTIQPSNYVVTVNKNNITCSGTCTGNLSATATGGSPAYTYVWSPGNLTTTGISNLCAGDYTLTVTDSKGCTITKINTITEPAVLTTTITSTPASCPTCSDGSGTISADGGNKPYDYTWTPGGYNTSKVNNLLPGTYTACVTDKNGCTSCKTVVVGTGTGISGVMAGPEISIYPNPVSDQLIIKSDLTSLSEVAIVNLLGDKVYSTSSNKSYLNISMGKFPKGIYFLQIRLEEGLFTRKIVKE